MLSLDTDPQLAQVHVFGDPDEPMGADECSCDSVAAHVANVVYHEDFEGVWRGWEHGWICRGCGMTSFDDGGEG